jgi:RNA polymerase sigma factor (sigma-70 family)
MRKDFSKYTDEELIKILKGAKPDSDTAFGEIYDRYGIRINAYIRTILNDRQMSEDVFQETFIRFYQKVQSEYERGTIIGFLITIARNLCLNVKRDAKNTISINDYDLIYQDGVSYEETELSDLLMRALDLLDIEYREPIIMRFFNDMPYDDIAEVLEITAARARYLVFTGKHKMKDLLDPYLKELSNK